MVTDILQPSPRACWGFFTQRQQPLEIALLLMSFMISQRERERVREREKERDVGEGVCEKINKLLRRLCNDSVLLVCTLEWFHWHSVLKRYWSVKLEENLSFCVTEVSSLLYVHKTYPHSPVCTNTVQCHRAFKQWRFSVFFFILFYLFIYLFFHSNVLFPCK